MPFRILKVFLSTEVGFYRQNNALSAAKMREGEPTEQRLAAANEIDQDFTMLEASHASHLDEILGVKARLFNFEDNGRRIPKLQRSFSEQQLGSAPEVPVIRLLNVGGHWVYLSTQPQHKLWRGVRDGYGHRDQVDVAANAAASESFKLVNPMPEGPVSEERYEAVKADCKQKAIAKGVAEAKRDRAIDEAWPNLEEVEEEFERAAKKRLDSKLRFEAVAERYWKEQAQSQHDSGISWGELQAEYSTKETQLVAKVEAARGEPIESALLQAELSATREVLKGIALGQDLERIQQRQVQAQRSTPIPRASSSGRIVDNLEQRVIASSSELRSRVSQLLAREPQGFEKEILQAAEQDYQHSGVTAAERAREQSREGGNVQQLISDHQLAIDLQNEEIEDYAQRCGPRI